MFHELSPRNRKLNGIFDSLYLVVLLPKKYCLEKGYVFYQVLLPSIYTSIFGVNVTAAFATL